MPRMIDWTLKERLNAQSVRGAEATLVTVQMWLRALAKQAEKDGQSVASDVLEKVAIHLKQGAI